MTTRHLAILAAVCETGSMTAAAQKLFISQPAVSLAIREMEDEYEVKLFTRTSRKIYLTDLGNEVYAYAKRVLLLLDDMNSTLTKRKSYSTLRIGTGLAFGKLFLPHIITAFNELHKDCSTFVTVDTSEVIEPMVASGELDLGIMEGTSHSPDLQHRELSCSPIVAVCHYEHPLANIEVVSPELLSQQKLLFRERNCPTREATNAFFASYNVSVYPVWESSSALSLLNAAACQMGIAILPYDHYQWLSDNRLVVLNVEGLNYSRYIDFVYRKNIALPTLAEEFIEFTLRFPMISQSKDIDLYL